MNFGRDGGVREQFRTLYESGRLGGLTDGQLLERFATGQGEAADRAFALLVERHGPMVLRVCRGVLADGHEAHDAFQATFLVLLRKSRGLWVRDSLGPWLHQVALRTASRARASLLRRRRHEQKAAERSPDAAGPPDSPVDRDWERVLHQEIGRLPERHRRVVVLCDLEGQTHAQAARDLGWPVGTVKSRLARARDRLRSRLIRRGLAPAGALAAALASGRAEAAVPPALGRATIALATNLAAPGTVPAAVARLARGALSTMTFAKLRVLAASLLVVAAAALGAGLLATNAGAGMPPTAPDQEPKPRPDRAAQIPVFVAETGDLDSDIHERGSLEASRAATLASKLQDSATLISILPEGTHVKKGDLVVEFDSSSLRDQRVNQEIAVARARSDLETARNVRDAAELARRESEASFAQQTQGLEGEIARARQAIERAERRIERVNRAREQLETARQDRDAPPAADNVLSDLDLADRLDAAEQTLADETLALDQAKLKLQVFKEFTRARVTFERQREIETARAEELLRRKALEQSEATLKAIDDQIAKTRLYAPADGLLVYAGPNPRRREAGVIVQPRQILAQIPDLSSMVVNAKVHESIVDRVQPGQRVKIRVDSFPDQVLSGEVEAVAPLPDPTSNFAQERKVYTTRVRIDDPPAGLRPGMTAEVTIHIGDRKDVVRVPVGAVARFDRKYQVAVKAPDGTFAWRVVELGLANDRFVEVREGLEPGDQVAADPQALRGESKPPESKPSP